MSYIGNTVIPGVMAECEKLLELLNAHDYDQDKIAAQALATTQELLELCAATGTVATEIEYDALRVLLRLPPRPNPGWLQPGNLAKLSEPEHTGPVITGLNRRRPRAK